MPRCQIPEPTHPHIPTGQRPAASWHPGHALRSRADHEIAGASNPRLEVMQQDGAQVRRPQVGKGGGAGAAAGGVSDGSRAGLLDEVPHVRPRVARRALHHLVCIQSMETCLHMAWEHCMRRQRPLSSGGASWVRHRMWGPKHWLGDVLPKDHMPSPRAPPTRPVESGSGASCFREERIRQGPISGAG